MRKLILVGAGGFGVNWRRNILPQLADKLELVALVDVNRQVLEEAGKEMGLQENQLFDDAKAAFSQVKADCAAIVVPPQYHGEMIRLAQEAGCDVLCEKPLSEDMGDALNTASFSRGRKEKLAITMSHSFEPGKIALRQLLASKRYGEVNYIVMRLTTRKFDKVMPVNPGHAGGIPGYFAEGVVHAMDLMRNLAGSKAETVFAKVWRPAWETNGYPMDMTGLITMKMENDVYVHIEESHLNAVSLDGWAREYVRVECDKATVIFENRKLYALVHSKEGADKDYREDFELETPDKLGHVTLIEEFLRWTEGGEEPQCSLENNLETCYMINAAVESAQTGREVPLKDFRVRWSGTRN